MGAPQVQSAQAALQTLMKDDVQRIQGDLASQFRGRFDTAALQLDETKFGQDFENALAHHPTQQERQILSQALATLYRVGGQNPLLKSELDRLSAKLQNVGGGTKQQESPSSADGDSPPDPPDSHSPPHAGAAPATPICRQAARVTGGVVGGVAGGVTGGTRGGAAGATGGAALCALAGGIVGTFVEPFGGTAAGAAAGAEICAPVGGAVGTAAGGAAGTYVGAKAGMRAGAAAGQALCPAPAPDARPTDHLVLRDTGLSEEAQDAIGSFENIKTNVLKDSSHYEAARLEAAGKVVARRPDGKPFDHIGELKEAYNGLVRVRNTLDREIRRPPAGITERGQKVLRSTYAEVQGKLNQLRDFLTSIGRPPR